jgi:beta-lysine 5,6-aminomutase beta subunit
MSGDRPKLLRAYGDRAGDGLVQLSFTLELLPSPRAKEAARRFAEAHGLDEVLITCMEQCGPSHSYFVAYGQSRHVVDLARIEVSEAEIPDLSKPEIEQRAAEQLGRKIVVVGACTGSDAHTVGIDAILNMKGCAGEKGLEAYKAFEVHNLGAQVENEALIARAHAVGADALLVSQVITQRGCHKHNARALVELLLSRGERDRFVLLLGGPRIDHKLALSLGFDAGFGPGSLPRQVAAFLVQRLIARSPQPAARGPGGLKCSA